MFFLPGKEKVVKIAMEGGTQMYDVTNPDQSIEIHTYQKDWCWYPCFQQLGYLQEH